MDKRNIFEVGIRLLGVWALLTATTTGMYSLYLYCVYFNDHSVENVWKVNQLGSIFSYLLFPLLFGIGALVFAKSISQFFYSNKDAEKEAKTDFYGIGLKLMGIYLAILGLAALVATFYEFLAVGAGNSAFHEEYVNSDLIFNMVQVFCGGFLALKTEVIKEKTKFEQIVADNVG